MIDMRIQIYASLNAKNCMHCFIKISALLVAICIQSRFYRPKISAFRNRNLSLQSRIGSYRLLIHLRN
ncbi:hypothetical protein BD408DRAFT_424155 [Parasitella parasitica]|nr:hypothetical protein BD408DRAFT_424155 [Parasitella parasitica]